MLPHGFAVPVSFCSSASLFLGKGPRKDVAMRRALKDLKIILLANLWTVPVFAALVGALFYFVAPPPPMHAQMATGFAGGSYRQFAEQLKTALAKRSEEHTSEL